MSAPGARSVVVTGCGAGIGRATYLRLRRDGFAVVRVEPEPEKAEAVEHEARSAGSVVVGDVTEPALPEEAARGDHEGIC